MRVLVCGSRTLTDDDAVTCVLAGLLLRASAKRETLTVIEGAANGADTLARNWAERWTRDDPAVVHEEYPADWATHGKAAGPIRNQKMLDIGRPDLVVAFVDKPLAASKGTADMVNRARKANVPTWVVEQ